MCLGLKEAINTASMLQCMLNNATQPVDFIRRTGEQHWLGRACAPTPRSPSLLWFLRYVRQEVLFQLLRIH